jgi:hypothetical protein
MPSSQTGHEIYFQRFEAMRHAGFFHRVVRKTFELCPFRLKSSRPKRASCSMLARLTWSDRQKAWTPHVTVLHAHEMRGLFENMERKMERTVAIKKLGNILGKGFGYRVDPKAPDQEERDAARIELKAANAEREDIKSKLEARRKAILEADAEFQSLQAAYTAARQHADKLMSRSYHYKITVGNTVGGMFFSVKAQGDSWEDVIGKLTEKQAA